LLALVLVGAWPAELAGFVGVVVEGAPVARDGEVRAKVCFFAEELEFLQYELHVPGHGKV
jgi:hypothetical protein